MDYREQGIIFDKLAELLRETTRVNILSNLHQQYCANTSEAGHSINHCDDVYATEWKAAFHQVCTMQWEMLELVGVEASEVRKYQIENDTAKGVS